MRGSAESESVMEEGKWIGSAASKRFPFISIRGIDALLDGAC